MNEVSLRVEGQETMSCRLTKETHQPCLKCVESETAELEAREQFPAHSVRNGRTETLAELE